jgi:arginase
MAARSIKLLGIRSGAGARTPGAEDGPFALRRLGLVERLVAAGHTVDDLGDIPGVYETRWITAPEHGVNNLPRILQVNRHTHACVLGVRRKNPDAFLLVVGGDHSLAIGTLAGLADACDRLGLIWIDAHADFNTPASSPSGNLHGMSLAVACGRGHRDLRCIADRRPLIDESDVWLLGFRDVDAGELAGLQASRVNRRSTQEWRAAGVVDTLLAAGRALAARCDHVHLSFDLDVLAPEHVRGTGTPVPGGLTIDEARQALDALHRCGAIHTAEFVEYNPRLDTDGRTGALTLELIETLLQPRE